MQDTEEDWYIQDELSKGQDNLETGDAALYRQLFTVLL